MDGTVGYRPRSQSKGSVFWFTTRMGRIDMDYSNKQPAMPSADDAKDKGPLEQSAGNCAAQAYSTCRG